MLIPHKGPEFRSHFLRRSKVVALVVYHLRKSINCCLNACPSPRQALALLCRRITVRGRWAVFVVERATLLNRSISNSTVSAIVAALLDIVATATLRMAHDSALPIAETAGSTGVNSYAACPTLADSRSCRSLTRYSPPQALASLARTLGSQGVVGFGRYSPVAIRRCR